MLKNFLIQYSISVGLSFFMTNIQKEIEEKKKNTYQLQSTIQKTLLK